MIVQQIKWIKFVSRTKQNLPHTKWKMFDHWEPSSFSSQPFHIFILTPPKAVLPIFEAHFSPAAPEPMAIKKGKSSLHQATCWAIRWWVTCAANKGRPALALASLHKPPRIAQGLMAKTSKWCGCLFPQGIYYRQCKLSGSMFNFTGVSPNNDTFFLRKPGI